MSVYATSPATVHARRLLAALLDGDGDIAQIGNDAQGLALKLPPKERREGYLLFLISAVCRMYTNEINSAISTLLNMVRATRASSHYDELSVDIYYAMAGCLSVAYRLRGDQAAADKAAAKLPCAPPRSLDDIMSALRDGIGE